MATIGDALTLASAGAWIVKHRVAIGVVLATLVVLIVMLVMTGKENLAGRPFNMIAFRHPNPIGYKYFGRYRHPDGNNQNDYYLENKMGHATGLGPELINHSAFTTRTLH